MQTETKARCGCFEEFFSTCIRSSWRQISRLFSVGTWTVILSENKGFWGEWFILLYCLVRGSSCMRADRYLQLLLVHRAPCQQWPSLGPCRAPCSGSPGSPWPPSFPKSLGQKDGLKITSLAKGSLAHPTDYRWRSVHRLVSLVTYSKRVGTS